MVHLLLFPGNAASAIHMQMYVLDGLHRWNENRRQQASPENVAFSSYDVKLKHFVSTCAPSLVGQSVIPSFPLPAPYTGEKKALSNG